LLAHRLALPPSELPRWKNIAFLLGIGLAIAVFVLQRKLPRVLALFAGGFWLLGGILGSVMLLLWLFTAHWAGYANLNILLLSPISFLLAPDAFRLLRATSH
jgi:hypothetical protein